MTNMAESTFRMRRAAANGALPQLSLRLEAMNLMKVRSKTSLTEEKACMAGRRPEVEGATGQCCPMTPIKDDLP